MSRKDIYRKIAVIFVADVVGYSQHMKKDEDETLQSFRACRKILEKLLDEHDGRVFNTAGDSILAEFSSAVSAVVCASEFQKYIVKLMVAKIYPGETQCFRNLTLVKHSVLVAPMSKTHSNMPGCDFEPL